MIPQRMKARGAFWRVDDDPPGCLAASLAPSSARRTFEVVAARRFPHTAVAHQAKPRSGNPWIACRASGGDRGPMSRSRNRSRGLSSSLEATVQPSSTATTVCITGGKTQALDGPYADSKEQLGGFYIIGVPDLDAAVSWAARCPAAGHGAVEVPPLADASRGASDDAERECGSARRSPRC